MELMIALMILVTLLTLAYPAYTNHIIKSRRADGHALLYEAAQRQQQVFSVSNGFASVVGDGGLEMSDASQNGYYTLTITAADATSYTLTATPTGVQTADTACGDLTLNHLNVKGCSATDCDVDRCW